MKSTTHTTTNLLVNQARNRYYSESHAQPTIENSREREIFPELKIRQRCPPSPENKRELKRTKLFIKNMVSIRCKIVLRAVLENLGLNYSTVELGEAEIIGNLSHTKYKQLKSNLLKCGLELIESSKAILVEKIRLVIVEMIHYADEQPNINYSDYLSEKLNYNYTYLANRFSEVKGISIQHFIISHKIERVKELLVYDEDTLSEIAWKLHYSSVARLSNQFKKMTGLTPTYFKNMMHKRHTAIGNV